MTNNKEYIYLVYVNATTWKKFKHCNQKHLSIREQTFVYKDFIDVCFYIKNQLRKDNKKYHSKQLLVYVREVDALFYHANTSKEMTKIVKNKKGEAFSNAMFILNVDIKNNDWVVDEMIGDLDKHILDLNFKLVPVETVD